MFAANLQKESTGPMFFFEGCNGKSFIDYVVFPEALKATISKCYAGEPHVLKNSDHLPVFVSVDIRSIALTTCEYNVSSRVRFGKLSPLDRIVKYENKLLPEIKMIIEKLDSISPSTDIVELGFSALTSAMHRASGRLPRTKYKNHLKPYWDDSDAVRG